MKKLIFLTALLIAGTASAQIGYYKTYADYEKKQMVEMDEYTGWMHAAGKGMLLFKKDGKKQKVACKDIWGYQLKECLFRIEGFEDHPVCMITNGVVVYYENGFARWRSCLGIENKGYFDRGVHCYLSKDLKSEIWPVAMGTPKREHPVMTEMRKEIPGSDELIDCIVEKNDVTKVAGCVEAFNVIGN